MFPSADFNKTIQTPPPTAKRAGVGRVVAEAHAQALKCPKQRQALRNPVLDGITSVEALCANPYGKLLLQFYDAMQPSNP